MGNDIEPLGSDWLDDVMNFMAREAEMMEEQDSMSLSDALEGF